MNPQEREVIDGIFDRLKQVEGQPRDPEAEQHISQRVAQQPYAPYAMAQALYVQEQALKQYAERVRQLEEAAKAAEAQRAQPAQGGGFLSGLFGGGAPQAAPPHPAPPQPGYAPPQQPGYATPPQYQPAPQGPWGAAPAAPAGGGFLRSAMTTAAGVAGGALLFEGIRGLMGGHGGFGGGFGGFGGQPVVNETVINEYGTPGVTDASSDPGSADFGGADAEYQDAGYQDAGYQDGGSDDFGDDDFGNDDDSGGGNWA
ncbi:MAG TPA: DUF2076 domain-containing protein [Hyphomicrobiales bacterium]|nr:DUF2076 domain-containing protein [Hyphomicrobiales bacterium]